MSKFFEALMKFEHEINQYSEGPAIKEIVIKEESYAKIKWVIQKEIHLNGHLDPSGDAFGFEHLNGGKQYFKCRGIKFVKELK